MFTALFIEGTTLQQKNAPARQPKRRSILIVSKKRRAHSGAARSCRDDPA
jgi:hypothetical protein